MNEYEIIKTNKEDYGRLILCLTYESLFTYIQKIEEALMHECNNERILIDQLLVTGNGQNRFISMSFIKGKLDFKSAEIVYPVEFYRKETIEWLREHFLYVENSILTDVQRQKIRDNIVFWLIVIKLY